MQIGQSQTNQTLASRSTCADISTGRIYYVASENGVQKLCGMDTSDGTVAVEVELPQRPADVDPSQGVWWKLGCDNAKGLVYVLMDYVSNCCPDAVAEQQDQVDRTLWRYDGAKFDSVLTFKVFANPNTEFCTVGDVVVNSEDGLLSIMDNYESSCDQTTAVFEIQTGSKVLETPAKLVGSPCAQVYDSEKNRFFGLCSCEGEYGLFTLCSCWWTDKEQPHMMEFLSDHSECGSDINTIDTENRLGFFNVHNEIATLSLDTGKKLSSLPRRSVASSYQHMPSTLVLNQSVDSISV